MLWSDKHCTKAKRKAEAYSEPHGLMCSKHKMNVDSPIRLPLVVADFMDKFSKLRTHLMSLHWIREYVFHPMMGGDVMKEEWNKRIQNLIKDFSSNSNLIPI